MNKFENLASETSPNNKASSDLLNEDLYKKRKDEMMKKFEQNIQKTIQTLNNYKYDDLSDSDDDDLDESPLKDKLEKHKLGKYSHLKELNSQSGASKNDSNSLINAKSGISGLGNERVKISDIIGNKTKSDMKEDINKKWNFKSDSDDDESLQDSPNDDSDGGKEPGVDTDDINKLYSDLKSQFEKKFSKDIEEEEDSDDDSDEDIDGGGKKGLFGGLGEKFGLGDFQKFKVEKRDFEVDDDSDDDLDLEKLKKITKDKFGINFGLNSSEESEAEEADQDDKSEERLSEQIRRMRKETEEDNEDEKESDEEDSSDSGSPVKGKNNDFYSRNKFQESDLMKKYTSDTQEQGLSPKVADTLKDKINFFSNKFLKEKTNTLNLDKYKQTRVENEESDSEAEEKVPSWKREIEEKFKKFDDFKKNSTMNSSYQNDNQSLADYKIDDSSSKKLDKFLGRKNSEPKGEEIDNKVNEFNQEMSRNIDTPKFSTINGLEDHKKFNKIYSSNTLKKENNFLKERLSEVEQNSKREKEMMKEHHNSILKSHIERHQSSVETMRGQYESEIDHLRSELAKARRELLDFQSQRHEEELKRQAQNKPKMEDKKSQAMFKEEKENNNSNLERNFLKLKELYDTLYKANLTLMKDQKDLEGKYSKLLRAYNKQSQKGTKKAVGGKRFISKHKKKSENQQQNLKRKSASRKHNRSRSNNNSITESVSSRRENTKKRKPRKSKKRRQQRENTSKLLTDETITSYICQTETSFANGQNSRMLNNSQFSDVRDESLFTNSFIQKSVKLNKPKNMKKKRRGASRSNSKKRYLGKETPNDSNLLTESNKYPSNFVYESNSGVNSRNRDEEYDRSHEKYFTHNPRRRDEDSANRSSKRFGSNGKKKKRRKIPKARKCMLTNNPNYF